MSGIVAIIERPRQILWSFFNSFRKRPLETVQEPVELIDHCDYVESTPVHYHMVAELAEIADRAVCEFSMLSESYMGVVNLNRKLTHSKTVSQQRNWNKWKRRKRSL